MKDRLRGLSSSGMPPIASLGQTPSLGEKRRQGDLFPWERTHFPSSALWKRLQARAASLGGRLAGRLLFLGLLLLVLPACNRAHYRVQADKETYGALNCATADPRWVMDYSITPPPGSRMYDPFSPDCPPMPPDDPESHELMLCVDGMHGYKHWNKYGKTNIVENPGWMRCLPRDENGIVVLDSQGAVQVAFLNSPQYQTNLENLYLSALTVTFERFRFDTQFFASNSAFYTTQGRLRGGGQSKSTLEVDNNAQAQKLFAAGGQLMVGLANSLVWQFSGTDTYSANTLLNFSFVQPLLQFAGRAVVLESLTDSERAMLANIRQMEQFRNGFYAQVVAGRNPGPGPAQGGPGIPTISSPNVVPGGFLGLLTNQVQIRNQRANVAGFRANLAQVLALYESNRIDRLQVEQARQSLYDAESNLLANEMVAYQDQLDSFKILLGLPPQLDVRISDPLLARFDLITPEMTAAQDSIGAVLTQTRDVAQPLPPDFVGTLESIQQRVLGQAETVTHDMAKLDEALPARRQSLAALATRPEVRSGSIEAGPFDVTFLDQRVAVLRDDFATVAGGIKASLDDVEKIQQGGVKTAEARLALRDVLDVLYSQISTLSLIQARARLDTIYLVRVDLTEPEALRIACLNRPDWMNARASLVDTWRQIEITANALQSGLNLTFSGDMGTVGNNPVRFNSSTGELRVGVQFDAPLTRVVERNAYRRAQIAYEQARRNYYSFEDRVAQVLRSELRDLQTSQLDFELRRAAVFIAIAQVELSQFKIRKPPPAAAKGEAAPALSPTTVRDIVDALQRLLQVQNTFVTNWVSYEVQRLNLDFDLGTMQLDDHCMWIDPGAVNAQYGRIADQPDAPLPELLPRPPEAPEPAVPMAKPKLIPQAEKPELPAEKPELPATKPELPAPKPAPPAEKPASPAVKPATYHMIEPIE